LGMMMALMATPREHGRSVRQSAARLKPN